MKPVQICNFSCECVNVNIHQLPKTRDAHLLLQQVTGQSYLRHVGPVRSRLQLPGPQTPQLDGRVIEAGRQQTAVRRHLGRVQQLIRVLEGVEADGGERRRTFPYALYTVLQHLQRRLALR